MDPRSLLIPGCTGFWQQGSPPPAVRFASADFEAAVRAGARASGSVELRGFSFGMEGVLTNFFQAALAVSGETLPSLQILLNPYVPCWAAARFFHDQWGPVISDEFTLVEPPSFMQRALGRASAVTPEDAARPLTEELLVVLAPAELEQVRYWEPKTVGEVLFNLWD